MILRWLGFTSALLALASCTPIVDTRGHGLEAADLSQIIPGQSGPDDVRAILGTPSAVSGYGALSWYYVSVRKETVGFLPAEVADQKVVAIHFDAEKHVEKIEEIGKDAAKDVQFVTKETPTEGHELTITEQLLGNFGRFNTPGRSIDARNLGR